ncbi:hypothetical protein EDC02_5941 [Micromonospora sp. Llam0]|uniref:minor capsid protein n=1 Tax=Micromonospora sp. Llam0 TaxID=2485143 RepID=UPI000F46DA3E|nr:minor capsid protein [Micromonospora sp. Llam0]ROO51077.1 hypothetical protein EDC02_5941 [Micromonospora sp. Llam0]
MAVGDGWTSRLIAGLAQHLEDAGVGTYRPDGSAYAAGETAIVQRLIPISPDRVITLAPYPIGTSLPGMADHLTAVQVRVRGLPGDSRDCDDLADSIFDVLDSLGRATWSGIPIVDMWRQSYTSLGQDGNGRPERSENYYVHAMRPTSNRTD